MVLLVAVRLVAPPNEMDNQYMTCAEARFAVWPPERLRLAEDAVCEAREHLAECEECRAYFEQDDQLLKAYQALRAQRAPRRVRERVFDALARERAQAMGITVLEEEHRRLPLPTTSRLLVAAALVTLAASAGALVGGRSSGTEMTDAPFVEDYLRRAVGQDRLDTDDASEVTRFVMRELGVMITPAQFAGIQVEAVEVCLLDGRRGAMIKYVLDGREVSHYVVPKADSERRDPAPIELGGGSEPHGPAVITWSSGRVEQALVGDLAAERLLELARQMPNDG
jgi:anti-sigma factor RsiW